MFGKIKGLFLARKEIIVRYDQKEVLRLRLVGDMDSEKWKAIGDGTSLALGINPSTEHVSMEFIG